ncbi:MAG: putative Ig domain-containing protein [Pseudomonadota bacterium]
MVRPLALLLALTGCGPGEPLAWITTTALPDGRVALDYQVALEASAETTTGAAWFLEDGALPPGVALDEAGTLAGLPTTSGDYAFTLRLEDGEDEDWADLSIHVPPVCLMSGYEPFGGYPTNPSIEALWPLDEVLVAGLDVRVVELPVVWDVAWDVLYDEIVALDPSVVISTGQAGNDAMRFETVAKNRESGTDNDGVSRSGEPVVEGGPETLADRLPEAEMTAAMEAAGYHTTVSSDAGSYLCNFIFYRLMYHVEYESQRDLVAGFIHVSPASAGYDYAVEDITAAHTIGLEALSTWMAAGAALSPPLPATVHGAPDYLGSVRP